MGRCILSASALAAILFGMLYQGGAELARNAARSAAT
jgi:hypothetical protein